MFVQPGSPAASRLEEDNAIRSDVCSVGHLRCFCSTKAFTLLELLVTIAIIAVLAVLLSGSLSLMNKSAWNAKTIQSIRTLQSGLSSYASDHDGLMMSPYYELSPGFFVGWGNGLSFLGYVADEGMNNRRMNGHFGNRWDNLSNETLRRRYPDAFNSGGFSLNNGARNYGELYVQKRLALVSQPAKTVLVSDAPIYPAGYGFFEWFIMDAPDYKAFPSSLVDGSAYYGFLDGHVARVKAESPGLPQSKPLNYGTQILFNYDQ